MRSFTIVLLLSVGMHLAHTFVDVQALDVERSRPVITNFTQEDWNEAIGSSKHGIRRQGYQICLEESKYTSESNNCILSAHLPAFTTNADSLAGTPYKRRRTLATTSSVAEFTVLLAIVVVISL